MLNSGDELCGNDTCDVSAYAQPEVDFDELPAAKGAIMGALNGHGPTTATPTLPALSGAIEHARLWAKQYSDYRVIVVLATDGLPTVCPVGVDQDQVVQQVAGVAADGVAGSPSVRTFVIGLTTMFDNSGANLEKIAQAGGTGQALIVQANSDVTAQFSAALEQIRGAALACEFKIPEDSAGPLDYDSVNVLYSNASVSEQTVLFVGDASGCDPQQGGWHYDVDPDIDTPSRIVLCPASCSAVQNDGAAKVDIAIGCKTQAAVK